MIINIFVIRFSSHEFGNHMLMSLCWLLSLWTCSYSCLCLCCFCLMDFLRRGLMFLEMITCWRVLLLGFVLLMGLLGFRVFGGLLGWFGGMLSCLFCCFLTGISWFSSLILSTCNLSSLSLYLYITLYIYIILQK